MTTRRIIQGGLRPPAPGRIIEIVGPAGIGKSTLVPMVIARVRAELGSSAVVLLAPDADASDVRNFARMRALVGSPRCCLALARIVRGTPRPRVRTLRNWASLISTMCAARHRSRDGAQVVVVEQGVVQFLRRLADLERLPLSMLPDAVVEITGHPAVVLERRLARIKHVRPAETFEGDRRHTQAARIAWRIADIAEDDATMLLRRWSDRFCNPPLTDRDIHLAIRTGRSRMTPEDPDNHWSGKAIRAAVQERISWMTVENGADIRPMVIATTIADHILSIAQIDHTATE